MERKKKRLRTALSILLRLQEENEFVIPLSMKKKTGNFENSFFRDTTSSVQFPEDFRDFISIFVHYLAQDLKLNLKNLVQFRFFKTNEYKKKLEGQFIYIEFAECQTKDAEEIFGINCSLKSENFGCIKGFRKRDASIWSSLTTFFWDLSLNCEKLSKFNLTSLLSFSSSMVDGNTLIVSKVQKKTQSQEIEEELNDNGYGEKENKELQRLIEKQKEKSQSQTKLFSPQSPPNKTRPNFKNVEAQEEDQIVEVEINIERAKSLWGNEMKNTKQEKPAETSSLPTVPSVPLPTNDNFHNIPVFFDPDSCCYRCKNPLEDGKYMSALGRYYHMEHWVCDVCNVPLDNGFYTSLKTKEPVCEACFRETLMYPKCSVCGKNISGRYIVQNEMNFHEGCFLCHKCSRRLGNTFVEEKDKYYCVTCMNQYTPRATRRGFPRCEKCARFLGTSFRESNGHLFCSSC